MLPSKENRELLAQSSSMLSLLFKVYIAAESASYSQFHKKSSHEAQDDGS